MAKKKGHHYISQFYLKGFIDPNNDPLIWVYRKGEKEVRALPSQSFGFENHYYSFITPSGERDSETLENQFGKIEGQAGIVFRKLRNNERPNEEEHRVFTTFLALLMVRVPSFRKNIEDTGTQIMTMISKMRMSNLENVKQDIEKYEEQTGEKIGIPPEELQRCVLEDEVTLKASPEFSLMMMSMFEQIEEVLAQMEWVYLKAPDHVKFVSSDNPITYNDPTHVPGSYFGIGLADKKVEVTVPISRDLACLGSWESWKVKVFQATPAMVKEINRRTVIGAVREVYASEKSRTLWRFVQKYKDSAPKVRVS